MVDPVADEVDLDELSPADVDFDRIRDALDEKEGLVRNRAMEACLAFADEDIGAVLPLVPSIVRALSDDNVNVVLKAVTIVNLVAREHPEELEGATGDLVALLGHDLPRVQAFAAKACQTLGVERPEWFVPHVDGLVAAVRSEITDPVGGADEEHTEGLDDPIRRQYGFITLEEQQNQLIGHAVATNLLVEVADRDPAAIEPHAAELVDLFPSAQPNVAADLADVIANVARSNPSAFADAVDPLCARLDSEVTVLVARSIRALGFLGDAAAIEPLREVAADEDRDQDVRDLASETADWLEDEAR